MNPNYNTGMAPGSTAPQTSPGFTTPPEQNFNDASMQGSMQQILSDNLGEYVVIEFLIGTQAMTKKEGVLYFVGSSYVTLYDDLSGRYTVCDIFSVKFVTFYQPGKRPRSV